MRKQFPLIVAEAITIHKSQGSTFEYVTVQIPQKNLRSLIYVALSRATKLENLYLIGKKLEKTKAPSDNDAVVKEMNRLRTEATLKPKFAHLHNVPDNCIQITSQNIPSLMKKIDVVRSDPVFACSKLILLQETWLGAHMDIDKVKIPTKTIVARNMLTYRNTVGHGTIIYSSEDVRDSLNIDRTTVRKVDLTVCRYKDILVVNIYRSQGPLEHLKEALDSIEDMIKDSANVVFLGDFNTEIADPNNNLRTFFLQKYDLIYLPPNGSPEPTTDNNTTIDGVFGKLCDYKFETYVYESFCSDHKPIVLRLIPKEEIQTNTTGLSQTLNTLNV